MQITERLQEAAVLAAPKLPAIDICIEWPGVVKVKEVQTILNNISNDEKRSLLQDLIETISMTHEVDSTISELAKKELVKLFGEEILTHPIVTDSRHGFFYSLTGTKSQFRCWYTPFERVNFGDFDKKGGGLLFHASCSDEQAFRRWLNPFVGDLIEWNSGDVFLAKMWVGKEKPSGMYHTG